MFIRGKPYTITKHAFEGMNAERPPLASHDIESVLEDPDSDDGRQAMKRLGARTVIVYYVENETEVVIESVSATRGRLAS